MIPAGNDTIQCEHDGPARHVAGVPRAVKARLALCQKVSLSAIMREMDTKRCPQCQESFPLTNEFWPKNSRTKTGFHAWCKPCAKKKKAESNQRLHDKDPEAWLERRRGYMASYRERHPERIKAQDRRRNLRTNFGISMEEYDHLSNLQGGRCAICGGDQGGKTLAVDHDHGSGAIRGLLCSNCNTALGLFNDQTDRLRSAIGYLESRQHD